MQNFLTIDIEDYYMVSAFADIIRFEDWGSYESRVENNTYRILGLLDENNVKATFFILGWVAEQCPGLVKDIYNMGHEVACHSYNHRLIYNMTPAEFREDTCKAKGILENIIGSKVIGYRAPSYSIVKNSFWALDILAELGFRYDSSIFPIFHDRYGIHDAPRFKYRFSGKNIIEYPISTYNLWAVRFPVSGGGYFRLLPYPLTKLLLNKINGKEEQQFVFYMHPWEIDFEQPKIDGLSLFSKFRHYINLDKTAGRFERLLNDFKFIPIKDSLRDG